MRLTISHSVSHCVFYSGSAHSHSVSHRVQDVAMMSAKCSLNCSAVELWYKIMLEIRNQSDLTENHIKRKATGYQRLSSNWLWLFMVTYKPSLADAKLPENIPQYFIITNLSRNFAQVMHTFPDILAQKIPGDIHFQAVDYTEDGFVGFC